MALLFTDVYVALPKNDEERRSLISGNDMDEAKCDQRITLIQEEKL